MSVAEQPDRFLNAREPVCLVLVMPEKINFFINSRQRTYRFSVRLTVIVSRIPIVKIADSRVPFIITISDLVPFLLQIPGSRPSNKPRSRKTYWRPSTLFSLYLSTMLGLGPGLQRHFRRNIHSNKERRRLF